jgi:methionyl-tRNA synthetase
MKQNRFYVTTPIYYPNDIPHIGHAYTTIAADVLSRWNKLIGKEVFFLTGTDEHGKKIQDTARKNGKNPKEFVDALIPKFKEAWKVLNIDYDKFIRTTDKSHEEVVKKILQKVYDKGDIYLSEYEGYYCTGCEAYYTEKDLVNGCCPIHKTKIEKLKEESYFFKLSKYQKPLLEFYKKNPYFISPKNRKQEVINRIKEGLKDLSISRTSFDWGISIPFDKKHVCYVWFDALFNYYSATREKGKEKFWPADVHLIGKDILWFHTVYWPAFLLSAEIDLPKKVFAHGWWTFDKEKISKSRGKVININDLVSIAGVDSARYFLLRAAPFGEDGDFSEIALVDRHNNELANKLGNLVSRISTLAEKEGIEKTKNNLLKKLKLKNIEKLIDNYEFDKALNDIFEFIDFCNEYVQRNKPWETHDKKVIYELADSIKVIAILLSPFIPLTSEKIAKQFNFEINYSEILNPLKISKLKKSEILFKKIDLMDKKNEKFNKSYKFEGIVNMAEVVEFNEWEKVDLRVAQIKKVEEIENADKLYKLTINLGEALGERIICAGIKSAYSKEELKGKKIIVFINLAPRKIRGIESKGMLLAAVSGNHEKVVLISPEKDIEVGSKIS